MAPNAPTLPAKHALLFTGHMIDQPDRSEPRFPARMEGIARSAIFQLVESLQKTAQGSLLGLAGGACGGDILFHEVCQALGIPSELYLALPRESYLVESVESAGPDWVRRFDHLYQQLPTHVLDPATPLPDWLPEKGDYSIWERTNLWMLDQALAPGGTHLSLIALWDGQGGDAPGGTAHLVRVAREKGAELAIIDTKKTFKL